MTRTTELTGRALTLSYLERQLLLRRSTMSVASAVHRLVGLQAQYSPSPHLALAARLDGFHSDALHRALTRGTVVKSTVMRGTLHLVSANRYPDIAATLQAGSVKYWRRTWSSPQIDEGALTAGLREFLAEPRPAQAISAEVERLTGGVLTGRGTLHTAKSLLPLVHMPPSGFWRVHGSADMQVWSEPLPEPSDAAAAFVRGYLAAYGPATRADIAALAQLPMSQVDAALARLEPLRRRTDSEGRDLYDLTSTPWPDADQVPPPRFLPKWDTALLSHADRRRILPEEFRGRVISNANGDVVATYLLDGLVAGEWKVSRSGPVAQITLTPFAAGTRHGDGALEAEAVRTALWVEPKAQRVEVVAG